jgi:hypothetical protein
MALIGLLFKQAGSFLVAQWKWIVITIIALILLFFSFKIYGAFKDRDALMEEREGRITQLVKDNTEAEIARQSAELVIARMLADEERINGLYDATVMLQEEIHAEVAAQKQVFLDHDFTKLSNAKPGLIIKPMNDATQERFDEISDIFNN